MEIYVATYRVSAAPPQKDDVWCYYKTNVAEMLVRPQTMQMSSWRSR